MVQIVEGPGSKFQQFFNAFKPGLEQGAEKYLTERKSKQQRSAENEALKKLGIDLSNIFDPQTRALIAKEELKQAGKDKLYAALGLGNEGKPSQSQGMERLLGGQEGNEPASGYTPEQVQQALPLWKKLDANKRAILSIEHPQLANLLEKQAEFDEKQNLAERKFGLEGQKFETQKEQFGQTHGLATTKEKRLGEEFETAQDLKERKFGLEERKFNRMSDTEKADILNKKFKEDRDFEFKRAEPILKSAEDLRNTIEEKKTAANLIKQTAASGNVDGWSQWFADALGVEPLRNADAALLKTATKDFFINNLAKAGSRPNQWIEQQINDAMVKIGRDKEANLKVAEMMDYWVDREAQKVKIIDQLEDQDMAEFGYVRGNIGKRASQEMKQWEDQRRDRLNYDIQRIAEEQNPKNLETIKEVPKGTPLTIEKARVFRQKFGKDAERAARNAGYDVEAYARINK